MVSFFGERCDADYKSFVEYETCVWADNKWILIVAQWHLSSHTHNNAPPSSQTQLFQPDEF